MADGGPLSEWAQLAIGGVAGAVTTFVAMRTKLALMVRDTTDLRSTLDAHIEKSDRRQLVILKLLADVARKVGVDQRTFDDALVRMLSDSDNANRERE